ncbi:MAG: aconitate hydratase AcnA [Legionellales bacterium]|nr:aconitate hydratase AcnA [Legionellales bacterium]
MSSPFKTRETLTVGDSSYEICRLTAIKSHNIDRLPFALKILLENLLRCHDGVTVTDEHIENLLNWDPKAEPTCEIAFRPARVILQDFTGVPAIVDLAAMRDAMAELGGDPNKINPLSPVELVIDHSVMVDHFGSDNALDLNTQMEFDRNRERYQFLKWGQQAFDNFRVVPPGMGIVHQVNMEYLGRVVFGGQFENKHWAYPDTLVGTDSHTTMINGLGVLGWGVGGIEAEAAMLGQPVTMLIPQVVGFKLTGALKEGATATDLVLRVVEMLRAHGVVGKFVEFFGAGMAHLPLADRATIANMAPEFGATCGLFPIDDETLNYLTLTGRSEHQIALIEKYMKAQGMFHSEDSPEAEYTHVLELDLSTVDPSIAGPKRPQDRISLSQSQNAFKASVEEHKAPLVHSASAQIDGEKCKMPQGAVVIAAITSCTNTSNPAVMLAAGLVAQNAYKKGLRRQPWVKTSLAPGSQVVTDYLERANVLGDLEATGFNLVGYGCTTCIGNSGPLADGVSDALKAGDIVSCAVLSGNRNFEGRVHPEVKNAYLASPPLVVAYALAGTMNIDFEKQAIGEGKDGKPVFLRDIWPSSKQIKEAIAKSIEPKMFQERYGNVFNGDINWERLEAAQGDRCAWDNKSTYVKNPPYFDQISHQPAPLTSIKNARVLALLGDSITTDHISPAGSIAKDSPAASYLKEHGVAPEDFNSYGSRRGNHEIMMRGTFANIRLRNQLAPGTEGGWTTHQPSGEQMTIFDASAKYREDNVPTVILAGAEYGTGSSRDWAAKGPRLLGVKAVITVSFERIHRSNLIGMGILPLQFKPNQNAQTLGLDGTETFDIDLNKLKVGGTVQVVAIKADGTKSSFDVTVRIDTPKEFDYFTHGGILHYVLRQLASKEV